MNKKGFLIIFHRYFFYTIGLIFLFYLFLGSWENSDFNTSTLVDLNLIKEENYTSIFLNEISDNLSLLNTKYYSLECNGTVNRERYETCINIYIQISNLTDTYNSIKNGSFIPVEKEEKMILEEPFFEIKEVNEINKEKKEVELNKNNYEKYMTSKKTVKLKYVLRGETKFITYDVYGGLNEYYTNLDRAISYRYVPPTYRDFTFKKTDDTMQTYFLKQLSEKIKSETLNKDDQARIAISLVQQLPYDWDSYYYDSEERYPYEVLYDQTGVCGEKSKLTAILLRELGYGVALFTYDYENHESIGIKCPSEYDYQNSGYCFVETTTPSIITDSQGDYVGVGELTSKPSIIIISEGDSMNSVVEEYNDNKEYQKLLAKGDVLSNYDYNRWENIVNKYGFIFD